MNWLVSSGSSGLWFLSCVVSSIRKELKFSAMPLLGVLPVEAAAAAVPPVLVIASAMAAS